MTRRGMFSIVSSIYDPLGFVAPFILKGKIILQLLCQDEIGWDERVDDSIIDDWLIWQKRLQDKTFTESTGASKKVDLER